jgi:hypothetical protein
VLDPSLQTQVRYQQLLTLVERINAQRRPHAPFDRSEVVPEKPMTLEDARNRVRPEDFEQMKSMSPDGTGFFMIRKVWRDPVIDALLSKAVATKMAVASLVTSGFGVDAYALLRQLFENVVVAVWLIRPDDEKERNRRIDTYVAHFEAFKKRLEEVQSKFAAQMGEPIEPGSIVDERAKEIAAEVFQDQWLYWAWFSNTAGKRVLIRLRQMAAEVGLDSMYDTEYFQMSAFAHSAPASLFDHTTDPVGSSIRRQFFRSDPDLFRARHWGNLALAMSNAYFVVLLDEIDMRYDFGLNLELHSLKLSLLEGNQASDAVEHFRDSTFKGTAERLSKPEEEPVIV